MAVDAAVMYAVVTVATAVPITTHQQRRNIADGLD
jgi:hypothetical protein